MDAKQKKILLIGGGSLVTVLVAVIAVLVGVLIGKGGADKGTEAGTGAGKPQTYTIDENNYQQIQEQMDAEVEEGYFETYMNTAWTFPDGKSESTDAVLGNSPNNVKPIRCEVVLAGTEEVVFHTGILPVGAKVPPFKLDVDLDAGTYDAVCKIYLLDEKTDGTYEDYSDAGFNVTITVEK